MFFKVFNVLAAIFIGFGLWLLLQYLLIYPLTNSIQFWLSPWTITGWGLWPLISWGVYWLLKKRVK